MFLLAGLLVSWSCGEDSNMEEVGNWQITAPTLSTPTADATVVLDESAPSEEFTFNWEPATTSNKFVIGYTFHLVKAGDEVSDALITVVPGAGGKDRTIKLTADQIDYALWTECHAPGEAVELEWVVVAKAIEKEAVASRAITISRYETERMPESLVITGAATEAGDDLANAISMRTRTNADDEVTGIFDVYTTLTEGETFVFRDQANESSKIFGGGEGTLEGCGEAIVAPETAVYRVVADLNSNTYNFLKIDRWSLVGDAVPGGWGGDVPLAYVGDGVWQAEVDFQYPYDGAGFIFRANGDWSYIIKQVRGTVADDGKSGSVIMESEAGAAGVEIDDSRIGDTGVHIVTLNLRDYTFSVVPKPVDPGDNQAVIGKTANPEADVVTGNFVLGEYEMPETLFLLSGGQLVAELTKDGETFKSKYLPLQASKTYVLNSAADGSGTTYNNVGDGQIAVDHDQAYSLTVDFSTGKLAWKHYNLKLFHWDDPNGGWDARQELLTTYKHPYTFEVTGTLTAGFDSKFISPWEVQFGTSGTALTGTMTNGGANYKGIPQNGSYKATIIVNDDFSEGEYSFVKQ